jgi:hypothetical protein
MNAKDSKEVRALKQQIRRKMLQKAKPSGKLYSRSSCKNKIK